MGNNQNKPENNQMQNPTYGLLTREERVKREKQKAKVLEKNRENAISVYMKEFSMSREEAMKSLGLSGGKRKIKKRKLRKRTLRKRKNNRNKTKKKRNQSKSL